jgi:hypothetical protein
MDSFAEQSRTDFAEAPKNSCRLASKWLHFENDGYAVQKFLA